MPLITVTLFDANGRVVRRDTSEAQTANDAEIAEMVALIEGGCPAHLAASLVKADETNPH